MTESIYVTKRGGYRVPADPDKILETIQWACAGLDKVDPNLVLDKAKIQLYDGIPTRVLHKAVRDAASNLVSTSAPDYQLVTGRLDLFNVRKEAFGGFEPPEFLNHVKEMIELGKYDSEILVEYTEEEVEELGRYIEYDRDLDYTEAAMGQWIGKYLVQDRTKDLPFETPQQACMLISMIMMQGTVRDRIQRVKKFYDGLSRMKFSLPTPIMAGVRTPTRQFSSCTLIMAGDSLDSINGVGNAIVKYASQRAGIGINAGKIRAIGSPIRDGEAVHTGLTPFFKKFTGDLKSCSQGGVRGASATLFYPFWHYEWEEIIVLKNNKGVEENRERRLDYGVQLNEFLWERIFEGGKITLFSPSDVDGLYEAFYKDQAEFKRIYENAEKNPFIRKKTIKAIDLMTSLINERASTGRIYPMFVDNANDHGCFIKETAPIYQSNLCVEVMLPTSPVNALDPDEGEIALCTLAAFNLGNLESFDELEELSELLVEGVDFLLDYQDYPVKAAEKAKLRRSLGIGVINYAYWLAKNKVTYSDPESTDLTHKLFEAIQFYLLKASSKLAAEKGKCKYFADTRYSKGELPIDWYKKTVDELTDEPLHLDWEWLRKQISLTGLRNSTLTALMPSETSSQISNATNGIEPAKEAVSVKGSKDGTFRMVVPEYEALSYWYEFAWDMPNNIGYLSNCAVMQKFTDQSISANANYDPSKRPDNKVSQQEILTDLYFAQKYGLKSLYYHNTRDGSGESEDDGCDSGACKI